MTSPSPITPRSVATRASGVDKSAARRIAFAARKAAFDAPDRAARNRAACDNLCALLQSRYGDHLGRITLSGYMPIRTEIDPLSAMVSHPGPVCVPVIADKDRPLEFHTWHPGCAMVSGAFGAAVPASPDRVEPDALIVPLLAFDRRGYRLGYGGGFYDRTLAQLQARGPRLAIGLAFAAQQVTEVPVEPTDMPLDAVVTENDIIRTVRE